VCRARQALLDKAAIDKERSRLERENADLRSILKQARKRGVFASRV
jgi:hypothetical protein